MAKNKILRCKFAGDQEDDYCCDCDGYNPVDDNGVAQSAVNCGGYCPEEPQEEEPVANTPDPTHDVPDSRHENPAETPCNVAPDKECVAGITNVIKAESGVSLEINGRWYKFMFSEERILPPGCNIEDEKLALWESVNAEVDAQVDAVRN